MKSWDFIDRAYKDTAERDRAAEEMSRVVLSLDESYSSLERILRSGTAQSIVRMGDTDASYGCLSYVTEPCAREAIGNRLWFSGIDKTSISDPIEFIRVLERADVVMVQPTIVGNERFWGDTYELLSWCGLLQRRTFLDVHAMYVAAHRGELFRCLAGKKVMFVGGKSGYFVEYFARNEIYRAQFPFLELEKVEIVGAIETPDLPDFCMNHSKEILRRIRLTYDQDIDVYLFACGLLAKYLAVSVHTEAGRIGWDVGNCIEMLMGLKSDRGWLCGPFAGYQHPHFKLLLDQNGSIVEVIRRRHSVED